MTKRQNFLKWFLAFVLISMLCAGIFLSVDFRKIAQTHAEEWFAPDLILKDDADFITDEDGKLTGISEDAKGRIEQVHKFGVVLPAKVKVLGDYSSSSSSPFYNYRIKLVSVDFAPETEVAAIGNYTFYECSILTSINIPDGVTSIGSSAFRYCSSLESITIPNGVTSIGSYAFEYCSSLTNINIPDGVTSLGDYTFGYCSSLERIKIPDGVTSIGRYAFESCSKLQKVEISPESNLESIRNYAFERCSSLTSINIPKGVTIISINAFLECSGLTSIIVSGENQKFSDGSSMGGKNVIVDISSKTLILGCATSIIPDEITSIGEDAFYGCSSLTNIKIPDGVTSIGAAAFSRCSSLTSINIPDKVTSIWDYAFSGCSSLTSINIPKGVTSINRLVFLESTENLTSITVSSENPKLSDCGGKNVIVDISSNELILGCATSIIPDEITSIGEDAFYGCSSLTSIKIPDGVTSIGNAAFEDCSSLTNINIPDEVTSIRPSAFNGCSSLTSINIPDGLTSIEGSVFSGCSKLQTVNISQESNLQSIEAAAFKGCSSLTSINIPKGVTSISGYAFEGCSSLTSINIPKGVTSISGYAFEGCSGLTSITVSSENPTYSDGSSMGGKNVIVDNSSKTLIKGCATSIIPEEVTSIGSYAFEGCSSLTSINIPKGVTSISYSAFNGCSGLTSITVSSENPKYSDGSSMGGKNVIVDNSSKTLIKGCATSIIPDEVTRIGYNAFYRCSSLTSINIPKGVTNIDGDAFLGCSSLTSINIPNKVTSIGRSAFYGCSSLTSINIPNKVTSIGSSAFYGCSSLTSINIPDGVKEISSNTFVGCDNLKVIIAGSKFMSKLCKASTNSAFSGLRGFADNITYPVEIQFQKGLETTTQKKLYKQDATWCLQDGEWEQNPDYQLPDLETGYWEDEENNYITLDDLNAKLTSGDIEETYVLTYHERVDLQEAGITVQNYNYDGSEHSLSIKIGEEILVPNRDYTITSISSNITNAGTKDFTVTGEGRFKGTFAGHYTILQKTFDDTTVTVNGIEDKTYNGEAQTQNVTITDNTITEKTLSLGTDYTVTYSENHTDAGTVSVTITAQGDYTGTITKNFTILPKTFDDTTVTVNGIEDKTYNGEAQTQNVTITDNTITEKTLSLGTDYTVTYSENHTDAGTVSVTITAQGNYTGTITKNFTISSKDLEDSMLNVVQEEYHYSGEEIKPTFTLKFNDKLLQEGIDFTVLFTNNVETGTAQMTITGKGNYSGQITYSYEILKSKPSYLLWVLLGVSGVVVISAILTTIGIMRKKKRSDK